MSYLSELIDRYGRVKEEMDSYKKEVDESNAEIKVLMANDNLNVTEGSEYVAKYQVIKSESFNDEKLVQKLHSLWSEQNGSMTCPYTKTIYVPNMEEIERALYNGELRPEDIADCKIVKETQRLTVTKKK